MPAGADEDGKVVAVVHPAGVGGRAGIPQQQRTGGPVGQGLLLRLRCRHLAVLAQPDVAVRVDEPRQHPALEHPLDRGRTLEGEPASDDPGLGPLVVRTDQDGSQQVQRHAPTQHHSP